MKSTENVTVLLLFAIFSLFPCASFSLTKTVYVTADSWVGQNNPGSNKGSEDLLLFGYLDQNSTTYFETYFKLQDWSLPAGATINRADLYFYLDQISPKGRTGVNLLRVMGSWAEGTICWNNKPAYTWDHSPWDQFTEVGWHSLEISWLLKYMISNNLTDYGFAVVEDEEEGKYTSVIRSREHSGGSYKIYMIIDYNEANVPQIQVTPESRDFGFIAVGEYVDMWFNVQNSGSGTLTGNATVSAPFSIVSGASYNLSASQSQNTVVRFSPTAAGSYSQNVTFTGGSGISRPVTGTSGNTGTLQAKISNVNGGSTAVPNSNGVVKLYKAGSLTEQQNTVATNDGTGSGIATFSNKNAGTDYSYEVSNTPNPNTIFGQEYWGKKDNVSITVGSTTTSNFTRYMPFLKNIRVFNGTTDITGQDIAPGTPLTFKVTVQNDGSAVNGRVQLVVDRNKDTSYDFQEVSGTTSLSGDGVISTVTFNYTPTQTGSYYAIASPSVLLNSTWLVTDGQYWNDYLQFRVVAGNLTYYVENENGSYIGGAFITLDPGSAIEKTGTTNSSGYSLFNDLSLGNHSYLIYNHQTQDIARELWGRGSLSVSEGANLYTHKRDIDYVDDLHISQNGQSYDSGAEFDAGSTIHVQIVIRNGITSSNYSMRTTMIIDRDQATAYDEQQTQTFTINAGSSNNFDFPFTIPASWAGQRAYVTAKVEAYVDNSWIQASLWQWQFYFDITGDDVPPQVLATTPELEEANWDIVNRELIVEFNEDIDQESVNGLTFHVIADGISVPGSVSRLDSRTYKFTAEDNLVYGASYVCTLASEIRDLAGNTLDGNKNGISEGSPIDDYEWFFTTGALEEIKLNVPYYYQSSSEWCWAASTSMILKYYGFDRKLWEIASDLNKAVDDGADDAEVQEYLNENYNDGAINPWKLDSFTSNENLVQKIKYILASGNPVYLGKNGDLTYSGHAIVLTGFNNEGVWLHDPSGAIFSPDLVNHFSTWDTFKAKVNAGFNFFFGDGAIIYKASTFQESSGSCSIQLIPDVVNLVYSFMPGLTFNNQYGLAGNGRLLELNYDGNDPYLGYRYKKLPNDDNWYYENTFLGYSASSADVLHIRPFVTNFTNPSTPKECRIKLQIFTENNEEVFASYSSTFNVPENSTEDFYSYYDVIQSLELFILNSGTYRLKLTLLNNNAAVEDSCSMKFAVNNSSYARFTLESISPILQPITVGEMGTWQMRIQNLGPQLDNFTLRTDKGVIKYQGSPITVTPPMIPGDQIYLSLELPTDDLNIGDNGSIKITSVSGLDSNKSKSLELRYQILGKVSTPIFSPAAGTYTSAQSVTISCTTAGATIRYTTNGADPTESDPAYSTPINIATTTTLKAKAFLTGWTPSSVASAVYTITGTVATPAFNPAAGTYTSAQSVVISCTTAGATIRYTTNGADPTVSDPAYSTPINIATTTTLKAKAFLTGWTPSSVASAVYTITGTVATPTFNPAAGTYTSAQSVTISCTTAGATIRYTTNGSEPSASDPVYASPIQVSTSKTIKARAFKEGWQSSDIASGEYIIQSAFTISGAFQYFQDNRCIPDVHIAMTGSSSASFNTPSCTYEIASLPVGSYTVTPSKTTDLLGVNSTDASKVVLYTATIQTLTPYQLIAADVNNSGSVNTLDASKIVRYTAGLEQLPSGDWKFDPSSKSFPNLAASMTNQNFIGIRMGDANGSWQPGALLKPQEASGQSVSIGNMKSLSDKTVEVPIQFPDLPAVSAITLRLAYPSDLYEYQGTRTNSADFAPVIGYSEGIIRLAWVDMSGKSPLRNIAGLKILLMFEGKDRQAEAGMIDFVDDCELADEFGNAISVNFTGGMIQLEAGPDSYSLSQNYPNPFNSQTTIFYTLPKADEVDLTIYNEAGKRIITLVKEMKQSGMHQVTWDGHDDSGKQVPSGLYIYRLSTRDYYDKKKLVLVR